MDGPSSVDFARFVWLVLASMMLVSRVLFHRAGAVGMREFLDRWKVCRTRQVWGALSLGLAAVAAGLSVGDVARLRWTDLVVISLLIVVLVADGLVNVLPAGFHTFKDRMQSSWVRKHEGTERQGDSALFNTVNLVLAVAAAGWAAAVILYRPASMTTVAVAALVAVVVAPGMIAVARFETRTT